MVEVIRPFYFLSQHALAESPSSWCKALWSDHHPDSFKRLPVIGGVILCRYVMPRPPENPVPHSFVPPHMVSPVEVCSHACIKPPAGAVVGPAVPGWIAVVVPVRGGERPVVVIISFAEAESITCSARVPAHCQPVAHPFTSHLELLVLCILHHPVKVLQLHPQHHVPVPGQQVDHIVAQPELTSVQLPEARSVLSPGAVEAHAAVLSALQERPSPSIQLHVTEDREAPAAEVRGHQVHSAPCLPPEQKVGAVSPRHGNC